MGLFKKKDEVPELPPAPTLPQLPAGQQKQELPELPSFPQSATNENLNQELVKSAVSDDLTPPASNNAVQFPSLPPKDPGMLPPKPMNNKSNSTMPMASNTSNIQTIPEPPVAPTKQFSQEVEDRPQPIRPLVTEMQGGEDKQRPMTHSSEPIFVRLDKFQSSQESFDKILSKVKEIESTLEKVKKVKSQEEEEIAKWTSEIEELKSRLGDIDDNIFDQV